VRAVDRPHAYEIFNIGKGSGTSLKAFFGLVEKCTKRDAVIHVLPYQPGDVPYTCADVQKAKKFLGTKQRYRSGGHQAYCQVVQPGREETGRVPRASGRWYGTCPFCGRFASKVKFAFRVFVLQVRVLFHIVYKIAFKIAFKVYLFLVFAFSDVVHDESSLSWKSNGEKIGMRGHDHSLRF
jgi:hypothetical protein